MLSIFNNGSYAWVVLIIDIIWAIVFGYRTYVSHKSGYHRQQRRGPYVNTPPQLLDNANFYFLAAGVILWTGMMIWINSDYRG